ncbi:component of cytosolic 80S ribosome and 40S small subunit [Planoprotostelium fungivorum]|uniref:40S ribosomal protein S7 n=1 Tax=Planoprotostelium fungivorum TaxID=1890364 RepID=A0A2P6P013_9EUKA|nr:component of cytosolic 80S ribosome and 40S small subunit [Planoprotostelium fungivorum]
MSTASEKIIKKSGEPTELENQVAQALFDLSQNTEFKADLKNLHISSAKQVDLNGGRKALVLFVPYKLLKGFHKVQLQLVRELEKKFSGQHVVIIAQRQLMKNSTAGQRRPYNRTVTSVHEQILDDLVYPTEIVGKRLRVRTDGSKLLKVLLDRKDQNNTEYKLETYAAVYKKLTGKKSVFEFPVVQREN